MGDRTTLNSVQPGSGRRGRLREGFDSNDLNRDGRLTLGEFLRFMGQVNEDMSTEECQVAFDEIDLNLPEEFVRQGYRSQRPTRALAPADTHS